ncbi:SurA N-terminal domain-containing protein [Nitrolancea hollandica]|uniref:Peptidylprolyl isomerase n=1 Tax=Nitrolancea hollandica Lb TaxID=1129897 RepID=I4EGF9_9BACT|nr:SurA N-terminal domain-containing protein [Nitrolancea hollandica]CCF83771.1 exported hypothetical protein [Nitrolancea hollandica Lb]
MFRSASYRFPLPRLLLILAIGCLSLVVIAKTGATTPTSAEDDTRALFKLDGHEYPDIVARVNGKPISGLALAQRVFIFQHSPSTPKSINQSNVQQAALDQLIREAVLIGSANEVGITASDKEVADFAVEQQKAILNGDDPIARDLYAAAAARLGVSSQGVVADPRALHTYRYGMILGRMYDFVRGTLPEDQRMDPEAFEKAVGDFVEQHAKDVQILIEP